MTRTDTKTLIAALRTLSRHIQTDDGVANAAIAEAADRLEELHGNAVSTLVDEQKPITPEWLRSIGFAQTKPCHVWGTPDSNWYSESTGIEIWDFNGSGEWLWVDFDSVPMRTRRGLRLLIEWASENDPDPK